jgi:hypothetical protein
MRIRINENVIVTQISAVSDLYRRFRKIFDYIISSINPGIAYQDPGHWYISMSQLEEELRYVLFESTTDPVRFLVGHTGIGKSTVLQHIIGGDQNVYHPETKTHVAYISFNSRLITNSEAWTQSFCGDLRAAADKIREEFNLSEVTEHELATFISIDSLRVLYSIAAPINTTKTDLLRQVFKENYRAYALEYLKLICSKAVGLEHLCIVVDDIEALKYRVQLSAIKELLQAHSCLKRNQRRKHLLTLLIAVRPDTYASLRNEIRPRDTTSEPDEPNLTPFTFEAIDFGQPVDLQTLFKKRFDTALETTDHPFMSVRKEDWKDAVDVCHVIATRLDGNFGRCIVALANANVREAIAYFMDILKNGVWFQRNMNPQAAFKIDEQDYAVNSAGVLRALAMPKTQMYVDRDNVSIPNLLHNSVEEESDLLVSYFIRYLLRHSAESNWASIGQAYDLDEVGRVANELFGTEHKVPDFAPTLEWMCSRGLLWRLDAYSQQPRFSITPRAVQTWELLKENSILLECFREDTYRSNPLASSLSPTWKLLKQGLADRFLDCIQFAQEVAAIERKHIERARSRNLIPPMRDTFGLNLLSQQLFIGLQASYKNYFRDRSRVQQDLEGPLMSLEHTIDRNIESLQDGLQGAPDVLNT